MGGMCLGSLLLARVVPASRHPLRVYAALELATGICGIAVLFGLPVVERFYVAAATGGMAGILLRGAACAVCLLPPTLLMGATLPAISRWIDASPEAAASWGLFYGGNIAGGVVGCLAAGFWLLRVFDMAVASYVAAAINVAVAVAAFALARTHKYEARVSAPEPASADGFGAVYIAIGLSGLCALGAEVVWTRLLSLTLGPTVYTFSIILAVFLAGLGIGRGGIAREAFRGATDAGLVPASVDRGRHMGGLDGREPAPLLGQEPFRRRESVGGFCLRSGLLHDRHPAGRHPLGREFSAGTGKCGIARARFRACRRRRLCREHRGRDRRRSDFQPRDGALGGLAEFRTRAGPAVGNRRVDGAGHKSEGAGAGGSGDRALRVGRAAGSVEADRVRP
jgi:hypothetical protein